MVGLLTLGVAPEPTATGDDDLGALGFLVFVGVSVVGLIVYAVLVGLVEMALRRRFQRP